MIHSIDFREDDILLPLMPPPLFRISMSTASIESKHSKNVKRLTIIQRNNELVFQRKNDTLQSSWLRNDTHVGPSVGNVAVRRVLKSIILHFWIPFHRNNDFTGKCKVKKWNKFRKRMNKYNKIDHITYRFRVHIHTWYQVDKLSTPSNKIFM